MKKGTKTALTASLITVIAAAILVGAVFVVFPNSYKSEIKRACGRFGVETPLVQAVIWTESKFRPGAVSDAGAEGLMQLMPSTARFACQSLGIEFERDRLTDPGYSITLGVWYLSYLLEQFDIKHAILAYNAGEATVRGWIEQGLSEVPYRETKQYLKRVTAARLVYKLRF